MNASTPASCIAELNALLAFESDCLRRLDFRACQSVLGRKQALAEMIGRWAADGTLRSLPELRALLLRMRDLTDANGRELVRALRVQRRVVGIVAGAVRRSFATHAYGRTGRAVPPSTRGSFGLVARA